MILTGGDKDWERNLSHSATVSTTKNLTWTDLGSYPNFRCKWPATDRMISGTGFTEEN